MKVQITFAIAFILSLVFSTSCVDDNIISNSDENIKNVVDLKFSFTFEDSNSTRAISDGTTVDKMFYAIISEDGKLINKSSRMLHKNELETQVLSMNISLASGVKYRAIFWVQNSECNAYTFNDDMSVDVNYNGANNDEKRDAFYGALSATLLWGLF